MRLADELISIAHRREPAELENVDFQRRNAVQTNFVCPDYEIAVAFDLPCDPRALDQMWSSAIQLHCPICGGTHEMTYRDAYVTASMSEFSCLPFDVSRGHLQ